MEHDPAITAPSRKLTVYILYSSDSSVQRTSVVAAVEVVEKFAVSSDEGNLGCVVEPASTPMKQFPLYVARSPRFTAYLL